MKNIYPFTKKSMLVAVVAAGMLAAVSCWRDDDFEFLKHPIHIQGSVTPGIAIPVTSGELSFNDLLAKLNSDYTGYVDPDADVLTLIWDDVYSDTIYPLNNIPSVKTTQSRRTRPKDETYFYTKDTIITQSIPIPIFDNATFENLANSNMSMKELWVNFTVAAKGEPASVAQYISASFGDLTVRYVNRHGEDAIFDPGNIVDSVEVETLDHGIHQHYDNINLAPIVNEYPKQVDVSFRLSLKVSSDIRYQNWDEMSFRETLDTLAMTRFMYSIGASVRAPFDISVENFAYNYDLDLGDGLATLNLDSIAKSFTDSLSIDINKARLQLDIDNRIPLNLQLDAQILDADSNVIISFIDNQIVRSAFTEMYDNTDPNSSFIASDTTRTSVFMELTSNDIERLKLGRTLRLRIGLNTDNNQYVFIRREDFMRIRLCIFFAAAATFDIQVTDSGLF